MSSALAKQYHSINIGGKNTWDDFFLIPASRPYVSFPVVNEKLVEVPGRHGSVDLTTALTGSPTYSNRRGSWEFYVMHEEWLKKKNKNWAEAYADINAHINGKILTVILDDAPDWKYEGRLKMGAIKPQAEYSTITIEYNLWPHKTIISLGNTTLN